MTMLLKHSIWKSVEYINANFRQCLWELLGGKGALFCQNNFYIIWKFSLIKKLNHHAHDLYIRCKFKSKDTVFVPVSARGSHLTLIFQRGVFIWGKYSFEGDAHWIYQRDIKIHSTCLLNQTIGTVIRTNEWSVLCLK